MLYVDIQSMSSIIWLSFIYNPCWLIAEDFDCSVAGLIRSSYLSSTPMCYVFMLDIAYHTTRLHLRTNVSVELSSKNADLMNNQNHSKWWIHKYNHYNSYHVWSVMTSSVVYVLFLLHLPGSHINISIDVIIYLKCGICEYKDVLWIKYK